MQKLSTTRLTGALTMSMLGVLAACSPKSYERESDTLVTTTPPAAAATPTPVPSQGTWTDANVVDVLIFANQGEIDYSQLGLANTTNAGVKQFAQHMVKEHGTMLDGVKALATKLNIAPVPNDKANEVKNENEKDIEDLKGKKGTKDFDDEFMDEQIDMHQETLDLLKDLDGKAKSADLKAAIAATKPKVQAHLDQAKAVKKAH